MDEIESGLIDRCVSKVLGEGGQCSVALDAFFSKWLDCSPCLFHEDGADGEQSLQTYEAFKDFEVLIEEEVRMFCEEEKCTFEELKSTCVALDEHKKNDEANPEQEYEEKVEWEVRALGMLLAISTQDGFIAMMGEEKVRRRKAQQDAGDMGF
mmetsp:Transcript_37411/g.73585  ORF Transcript_37411/g.73585 Transcript_37411/m.73585 type:complete len:153 (+) Transcript_37411:28-486(+)